MFIHHVYFGLCVYVCALVCKAHIIIHHPCAFPTHPPTHSSQTHTHTCTHTYTHTQRQITYLQQQEALARERALAAAADEKLHQYIYLERWSDN
jgi:hypothetical protein